jgi:hypothetical protein
MVECPDGINGEHGGARIELCGRSQQMAEGIRASPRAEPELEGRAGRLEGRRKVLCKGTSHEAAEHVAHDQRPYPAIGLPQRDHATRPQRGQHCVRDSSRGQAAGRLVQEFGVALIIQQEPQVLVGHAGRACGGAPARTPQAGEEQGHRQCQRLAGLLLTDGLAQRDLLFLRAAGGVAQFRKRLRRPRGKRFRRESAAGSRELAKVCQCRSAVCALPVRVALGLSGAPPKRGSLFRLGDEPRPLATAEQFAAPVELGWLHARLPRGAVEQHPRR